MDSGARESGSADPTDQIEIDITFRIPSLGIADLGLSLDPTRSITQQTMRALRESQGGHRDVLSEPSVLHVVDEVVRLQQEMVGIDAIALAPPDPATQPRIWRSETQLKPATTSQEPQKPSFSDAFACLAIAHPDMLAALCRLEIKLAVTLTTLQSTIQAKIEGIRTRHAEEMEAILTKGSTDPSETVSRQVAELQTVEAEGTKQLTALQQNQKREFRASVLSLYNKLRSESPELVKEAEQKVRVPKRRRHTAVRPIHIPSLEARLANIAHTASHLWIGSQMKRPYAVYIVQADHTDMLTISSQISSSETPPTPSTASSELPCRMALARDLYTCDSIGGWARYVSPDVLFEECGESGVLDTGVLEPWRAVVSSTTELHFPNIDVQLSKLSKEYCESDSNLIVTRHSNTMFPVHFHMLPLKTAGADPIAHSTDQLLQVLALCDSQGVRVCCIPSSLTSNFRATDFEAGLVHILKTVKMFMADNCAALRGSLEAVVLTCPASDEARFNRASQLIRQHFGC